ncbi:hypothetical protein WJX81_002539 [Elliptochloris bilobata]|uniref:Uncharacterized protein n=1 Tax=Elliptochloris bilobata TaxID=381761 RepID=A0AAW1RR22_9CHLO
MAAPVSLLGSFLLALCLATVATAGAQPVAAPAPAPGASGPAANTQFTLMAANASFEVAADNTTTLTLIDAVPTVVYTQSAPVHDVGIYNASFFTSAPFYVDRAWLDQPDAVLLGGGGAVATALVMRLQGIPYYSNGTFAVNATLLSASSQLKYANGRAAAALLQATATPAGAPPLNLVQSTAGGASLANVALVIDFDTALFGTPGAPAPAPGSADAVLAPRAGAAVSTANGVRLAGVLNGAVCTCAAPPATTPVPAPAAPATRGPSIVNNNGGLPYSGSGSQPRIVNNNPPGLSITNNNGPSGDFANLGGAAPGSITNNNDPSNPPPGAPPAGSYNVVTTTSDCSGHTTTSYSMVPGQSGVSYVSNNNCLG